ncbi:LSU ribosomal protein L22P [Candidatus Kryptonium thompsonii]|jgi:large subunit ribosomal protein L22|uniref:Large ribosomal subunit protein uL22 n=1 Tax=Candidatus Kryptonium thompsonii TaxID=1633631 RepID=A0A0P1LJS0_9BACT|nr:50S ribosomal protein L22 [Candidatus Kryptonium thompsoni]CUS76771.1 LSU ribosomal protein L22P [Candidatus Kryptonium thompsoni]CUS77730.1 LSU ribosomal protein L22P [Candidatus Kryptonium thompsoni]CUS81445.1 LSU ribosomal protein L22P [Candidatus Kryptonium thompsoni]CUS83402.1 LSU ribosomal protein L22P [Candidatus Kryptonium thompsoni]CUS88756.1 LSU ribosomal protein L22P [Candidatus Kryptonium thompsoni]
MEAKAVARYIPSSPRKMRAVIDLIRGKSVDEALNILHYTPKRAAKIAEKVLRSAVANFMNKETERRVDISELYVKSAYVDPGPMLKRVLPAPFGRAYIIRKRSNHLTIVVAEKSKKEEQTNKSKTK